MYSVSDNGRMRYYFKFAKYTSMLNFHTLYRQLYTKFTNLFVMYTGHKHWNSSVTEIYKYHSMRTL